MSHVRCFLIFFSVCLCSPVDLLAAVKHSKPGIQKIQQKSLSVEEFNKSHPTQGLPESTKKYRLTAQGLKKLSQQKYLLLLDALKADPAKWIIISTRIVVLGGFAYESIVFANGPQEVAISYGVATAFMQFLLGYYNELELKYIAHQVQFNLKRLKQRTWPLVINDSLESGRYQQLAKWISLEASFLTVIESAKAISSPDIDFSILHILKEVFITGLLTTWMQEPLDTMNSTFTQRKLSKLIKNNYVTPRVLRKYRNMANVRTASISLYSTILAFMYLNPESFARQLPFEVGHFMAASGLVFHATYMVYKNPSLFRFKQPSCQMLFSR